MRNVFLVATLLALTILASPSIANAQTPTFSDIPWGSSTEEVSAQLSQDGFTDIRPKRDGDLQLLDFAGTLLNRTIRGEAILTNNQLNKIAIFISSRDDAIGVYNQMKTTLSKKYGPAQKSFQFFSAPYYDGDGYEETAFRVGKATFASYWHSPTNQNAGIALDITKSMVVSVQYESDTWSQELDKLNAAGASHF